MNENSLPAPASVPPPYTLIIKNDSSVFENKDIYIFAKGVNVNYGTTSYPPVEIKDIPGVLLNNGKPIPNARPAVPTTYELVEAVVAFDTQTGVGTVTSIPGNKTQARTYSYRLDQFSPTGDVTLKIPALNSGRLYISIGQPLSMKVTEGQKQIEITSGVDAHHKVLTPDTLTFAEPNGASNSDPNYPVIFDKIEFSYNSYGSWIDTTSVDFYGVPLSLTGGGETKGLTETRQKVLNTLHKDLPPDWKALRVAAGGQTVRVLAPQKLSAAAPFNAFFDQYIDAVWDYYSDAKGHTLRINCQELAGEGDPINYRGSTNAQGQFVFTLENPSQKKGVFTETCTISGKPSSGELLLCKGPHLVTDNQTLISVLVKTLSAAMNAGLLPLAGDPVLYDKHFSGQQMEHFYQPNPLLGSNYPDVKNSCNLYAKTLHSFGQGIYAFPFDDVLGQDSTIHLEPAKVGSTPVTLTLGDMTGTSIPTSNDHTVYTAEITVGANAHGSITNNLEKSFTLDQGPTIEVPDLTSPFTFTYNVGEGDQDVTVNAGLKTITQGMGSVALDGAKITLNLAGGATPRPGTKTGVHNGVKLAVTFVVGGNKANGFVGSGDHKTLLPTGTQVTVKDIVSPFKIHYDAGEGMKEYSIDAANNTSDLAGVVVNEAGNSSTAKVLLPGKPS